MFCSNCGANIKDDDYADKYGEPGENGWSLMSTVTNVSYYKNIVSAADDYGNYYWQTAYVVE